MLELPALFEGCQSPGMCLYSALQNAALFWWNLRRNGDGDGDTLHAGCPVLAGDKWGEWQHPVSPQGDSGSEGQQGGHPPEVGIGDRDRWGLCPFQWQTSGSMSTGRSFGGRAAGIPGTERPAGLKDAAPDLGAVVVTTAVKSLPSTAQLHWASSMRRRGCCRGRRCFVELWLPSGKSVENKIQGDSTGGWEKYFGVALRFTGRAGGEWMVPNPHKFHSLDPKHTLCPISRAAVRAMALLQPSVCTGVTKAATRTRAKPTLPLHKKTTCCGVWMHLKPGCATSRSTLVPGCNSREQHSPCPLPASHDESFLQSCCCKRDLGAQSAAKPAQGLLPSSLPGPQPMRSPISPGHCRQAPFLYPTTVLA